MNCRLTLVGGLVIAVARFCLAASGVLYVSTFTSNQILAVGPSGSTATFTRTGLNGAAGLAFDASGDLYVANIYSSNVRRFSPAGVDLGIFASAGLRNPNDVAFDENQNLYVDDGSNSLVDNRIHEFSPSGADIGGPNGRYPATLPMGWSSIQTAAYLSPTDSIRSFGDTRHQEVLGAICPEPG